MANYNKYGISLEEYITMELSQPLLSWSTSGLQVPFEKLPDHATVTGTTVFKDINGSIKVQIHFTIPRKAPLYFVTIASLSSLEELKERFPNLFVLTGNLHALG
ncbi:MAG: hypothetical protein IJ272_04915 [Clostridia bacterium]|nr:hypothetical protein [Clostridia bacterium]